MARILVTGGAGYIGSVLVPMLLEEKHHVTVFDSLMHGGDGLIPCFSYNHFNFTKGDIRDYAALLRALDEAEIIIHLAAIVGYPACNKDPILAKQVNQDASKFIADNVRPDQLVIFSSTGSNYGAVKEGICTEETPLNPLTVYGTTKTAAETYFLEKEGCNAVVFRFATAFGISPRLRLDLLINDFVYQVVKNNYLLLYEKSAKRTFVHVKDIARAIIFTMSRRDQMVNQAFNVGSDAMNFSKEEIALLLKKYKPDYYLHFAEVGKDEDQRDYEVSYEKISRLGYTTTIDIEAGIQELMKVMRIIEKPKVYSNV